MTFECIVVYEKYLVQVQDFALSDQSFVTLIFHHLLHYKLSGLITELWDKLRS